MDSICPHSSVTQRHSTASAFWLFTLTAMLSLSCGCQTLVNPSGLTALTSPQSPATSPSNPVNAPENAANSSRYESRQYPTNSGQGVPTYGQPITTVPGGSVYARPGTQQPVTNSLPPNYGTPPSYTSPPSSYNGQQPNYSQPNYNAVPGYDPLAPSAVVPYTGAGASFSPTIDPVTGLPIVNGGSLGFDGLGNPAGLQPPVVLPEPQVADLIINGYPARTGRIMFGGAVNSDAGVTGQITVDERNFDISRFPRSFQDLFSGTAFRGAGQTFRLEAVPGNQFQRYTVQFADPNLLGYLPISMSLSGFLFSRRFNDWDEERIGGRLSFGYRVTPDLSIAAGVSGQNVEISRPRTNEVPALNSVLGNNALYSGEAKLIHDTRDSPIQASSGHYLELKYEKSFGDFDYSRYDLEYRQYFLLSERADRSGKQTLSLSTRVGYSGEETPIFENYFAGGYATIRGFNFRGASPTVPTSVGNVQVGGRFQWLNTAEYMFPITADDAFRGVAFVDFGTVEPDSRISSDDFRVAPGLGLRVAIPMLGPAPLAFDFAYPVAMADSDDRRIFSFYMSLVR